MDEIESIGERAEETAARIADVFEAAGERIASALERAARSGELSFNRMAESILQDLARTAIQDLVIDPLTDAVRGLGGGSGAGGAVTVNMNVTGATDAASFSKSSGQIAAGLARQVARGQRYG